MCTLSADSVNPEDSGQWRCEVGNKHGKSSATCSVKVIGKSVIAYMVAGIYLVLNEKNQIEFKYLPPCLFFLPRFCSQ